VPARTSWGWFGVGWGGVGGSLPLLHPFLPRSHRPACPHQRCSRCSLPGTSPIPKLWTGTGSCSTTEVSSLPCSSVGCPLSPGVAEGGFGAVRVGALVGRGGALLRIMYPLHATYLAINLYIRAVVVSPCPPPSLPPPSPSPPPPTLQFMTGVSSGLLGITGFETSSNFVEEQAPGVFVKTLRNMYGLFRVCVCVCV
jgi:hypothetical protein